MTSLSPPSCGRPRQFCSCHYQPLNFNSRGRKSRHLSLWSSILPPLSSCPRFIHASFHHPPITPPTYPSTVLNSQQCLIAIGPSSHPSIQPPIHPLYSYLPIVCPQTYLSACLLIYLSIHPPTLLPIIPSIHPSTHYLLPVHPSPHLTSHSFANQLVSLSIGPSTCSYNIYRDTSCVLRMVTATFIIIATTH